MRVRLLRRLLFSALVLLLLLGCLEGALRLAGFSYRPGEDLPAEARFFELSDPRIYEEDPELVWRLRPSATIDIGVPAYPRFRTNALGLRGAEVPPEKGARELRVLCLGDSVTFGLGLAEGETVPERLAEQLAARPPAGFEAVRVLNAGVSGWSCVQGERQLARLAGLQPDVVVFWFGMNDSRPAQGVPDSALRLPPASVRAVRDVLAGLRVTQLAARIVGPTVGGTRVPPADFAEVVARLEQRAAQQGGPRLVYVRYPERLDVTLRRMRDVLATARDRGAVAVRAPQGQLLPFAPASPRLVQSVSVANARSGRVVVFGGREASAFEISLTELEARIERLADWKAAIDALQALLPPGALGYADLFGGRPPDAVFTDNCHLTPEGAAAAGAALADAVRALYQ